MTTHHSEHNPGARMWLLVGLLVTLIHLGLAWQAGKTVSDPMLNDEDSLSEAVEEADRDVALALEAKAGIGIILDTELQEKAYTERLAWLRNQYRQKGRMTRREFLSEEIGRVR